MYEVQRFSGKLRSYPKSTLCAINCDSSYRPLLSEQPTTTTWSPILLSYYSSEGEEVSQTGRKSGREACLLATPEEISCYWRQLPIVMNISHTSLEATQLNFAAVSLSFSKPGDFSSQSTATMTLPSSETKPTHRNCYARGSGQRNGEPAGSQKLAPPV